MKHSVGRNISRLRLSQGMTQEQLAQRMDVTPQAVSKWENDLNYPDVAALPRLAALLGGVGNAIRAGLVEDMRVLARTAVTVVGFSHKLHFYR